MGRDALGVLYCAVLCLSLIHISEPTRQEAISYAVFCLKKKTGRTEKAAPIENERE